MAATAPRWTTPFQVRPIGRVESPLIDPAEAPMQAEGAPAAWLVMDEAVGPGLKDLRVDDRVLVLTWLDLAVRAQLVCHPGDDPDAPLTGVFSTRSPNRPNPIGVHPARIVAVDGLRVRVDRLEAVDGTPVVDLKPVLTRDAPAAVDAARAVRWEAVSAAVPALATYAADGLLDPPAYLATLRASGAPRVHPVTPILTEDGLYLLMDPSSPKGPDLTRRRWYALHNGVPDVEGTGGEVTVRGVGTPVADRAVRAVVAEAASYEPEDDYVLFELLVTEVHARAYGDVELPCPASWVSRT